MISVTHNYFSRAIGMATEIRILLPDAPAERTVFLLSPEGGSGSSWITSTKVSVLCDAHRAVFVLVPSLQGCYTDMAYGYAFYASLKETLDYLRATFPAVPLKNGVCYAVGASTGGLAAIRLALDEPDLFAGAAVFSGRLDITAGPEGWFTEKRLECLYGDTQKRRWLQDQFEDLCRKPSEQTFFLFVSQEDPCAGSSERIAQFLEERAYLISRSGKSGWKTWSDWLGADMKEIGGAEDVRQ